jgi:long-chain acyl-CoA synthetase
MSEEELVNDDKVKGLISAEIKLNCYGIKKFEIPAAFAFVAPFTAANSMVTPPKMSIRRHVVMKTYEELISDLYERRINRVGDLKGKNDLDAA